MLLGGLLAPQIFKRFVVLAVVRPFWIQKLVQLLEAIRWQCGWTTHGATLLSAFPEKKEVVAADTGVVKVLLQSCA